MSIITKPIASITDEVLLHSTPEDCWTIINGELYDVTSYIPLHPGGASAISQACGVDATDLFKTKGGGGSDHSSFAYNLLQQMRIQQQTSNGTNETTDMSGSANADQSAGQNSTQTQQQASQDCISTEISQHSSSGDCWIIIQDNVYAVSSYAPLHPGGAQKITNYCGEDATSAFFTKDGTGQHTSFAIGLLDNYYKGTICSQSSQEQAT